MSNRPVKKKKVVEITQEDFDVEWTPPARTSRDRLIQFGVLFLIIAFLLPAVTCMAVPDEPTQDPQQQAIKQDPIEQQIKLYSQQVAQNPNDPAALANLGLYTTFKASMQQDEGERMTLLATAEKYLRDALKSDPDYAMATSELAKNLFLQDKKGEAESIISEALKKADSKLSSDNEQEVNEAKSQKVDLLQLAAAFSAEGGNKEDALAKMAEAIELKPGEPKLYMMRGQMHQRFGDKESARKDLSTAVDIGQKIGDQATVAQGQQMIEALDNPPKPQLEVVKMEETDLTVSPSPSP